MNTENISIERAEELARNNPTYKTILEHDDRYSEHRPAVIIFIKEGTKYIHGIICHREDGQVKPNYWIGKFDKSKAKVTVYDGARWDLVEKYDEYRRKKFEYQDARNKFQTKSWYEYERKAREAHNTMMEQWDRENPAPANPFEAKKEVE